MAVEVEGGSQIEEFLGVLKRKAWWICVPAVLATTIGTCYAVLVPKKYVTKTQVLVRDTISGQSATQQEAMVAPHQIKSLQRVTQILTELQWPEYLELRRSEEREYIKSIQENLKVERPAMPRGSTQQIVDLSFAHTDPRRSYEFLVEASTIWQDEVLERGRNSVKKTHETLVEQQQKKEQEEEAIRRELKDLRLAWGVSPSEDARSLPQTDPAFEQAHRLEIELLGVATEIEEREGALALAKARLLQLPERVSQTVTDQAGTSNQAQITELHAKIQEMGLAQNGLKPAHSDWKKFERAKQEAYDKIRFLQNSQTDPVLGELEVPNKERIDLELAVEAQEAELAMLKSRRGAIEARITETAERQADVVAVYSRLGQLQSHLRRVQDELTHLDVRVQEQDKLLAQVFSPAGNPFEVLEKPSEPTRPTEPDPIVIVAFSVFLGLGIGLGLAVLSEYTKNCFRSVPDISRVMVVPVLGTINVIATRRELRRTRLLRATVGGATLVFVGLLGWVTWAWAAQPQLLSNEVLNTIENLREHLQ